MICVYPSDCTDFSTNGLAVLAPSSCVVTETLNGEWELTLVHPHDEHGKWYHLIEGGILRVPVPAAMTPRVSLVTPSGGGNLVEIYAVNTDSPQASVRGGTLRLRTGPGTEYAVLRQYPNGTQLQVIAKTNASWYEALLPDGKRGYMDARFLSFVRTEGSVQEAVSAVVEARQLRDQPFRVYRVVPELNQTTVYARHIFYDLADNMIQRYVPGASTTGAVVVQQLANGCMSEHPFTFYSDLTGTAEDASFENVNPVEAFLGEGGLTEIDCLTGQYTAMTLGTVADTVEGNIISTRQLPSGSITGAKLALNSVGAGQLQNGSAGSLQIKNAAIGSAHIQEASIDRAHIAEALIDVLNVNALNAVTAKIQELAAGHITTDELYASIASIACA